MSVVGAWLRHLRAERAAPLALALVVLVSSFSVAAGIGLLDRAADDALRGEIRDAAAGTANVELIEERRIPLSADEPLTNVAARGDEHAARIPANVSTLIDQRNMIVDTPFYSVRTPTPLPSTVALRIQRDVDARIRVIDGRMPTGASRTERFELTGDENVIVMEAALAAASAEALAAEIGDTLLMTPDPFDPLADRREQPLAVEIVGTFEAVDATDPFWSGDTELAQPWIRSVSDDIEFQAARALVSADAYPAVLDATSAPPPERLTPIPPAPMPLRYRWRFILDTDRIQADASEALIADVRRMEGLFPGSATSVPVQGTLLRSSLLRIIEAQRARWRAAETVLAVVGLGVVAIGCTAIALVSALGRQRRRDTLAAWAARGASARQLAASTLAEGLLITLPPAVLAALAAALLLPGAGGLGALLAGLVALFSTAVLLAAVARSGVKRQPERTMRIGRRPSPRRLVVEVVVVVLAVAGALLLRERGVAAASSAGQVGAADPLMAAVPALVGIAAGIVAVRLLPLLMRGLVGVAGVRRDLVPILGLQRARREGSTAAVLIVILAGSMLAMFSLATLVYVDRAAAAVAWQAIGAPYRVTSRAGVVPDIDATDLPGVESAARMYRTTVATRGVPAFELLALDTAAFRAVTEGTPAAAQVPGGMSAGGSVDPLPAVVSTQVATSGGIGVQVGDTFGVVIRGRTVSVRAIEVRDEFPTLPVDGRFAVISLSQLEAAEPDLSIPTSALLLRAPEGAESELRDALAPRGEGLVLESREERQNRFRSSPVMAAVVTLIGVALALTAAYTALAVASALAVAGAARASEMAHLWALGVGRRDAVGLVLTEHGTTMLLGFVIGSLLGLALFVALLPGLGLDSLVGSPLRIPFALDPGHLGLMLAAFGVTATVGIGLSVALQRAASPTEMIRRGVE